MNDALGSGGQMQLWAHRQMPSAPLTLKHITRLPVDGDDIGYCAAHGAVHGTPGDRCLHPRRVVPYDDRTYARGPAGPRCAAEPCQWACCTEADQPLDWAVCGLELRDEPSQLWADVWSAATLGFSAHRRIRETQRTRQTNGRTPRTRAGRSL